MSFAEGVDRVRLRTADGRFLHVLPADDASAEAPGTEGALDPALLAGRTDLPPLTTDAVGTELALIDWGEGVLTLRASDGRYLSVAEDGFVRASADQPGAGSCRRPSGWNPMTTVTSCGTRERVAPSRSPPTA